MPRPRTADDQASAGGGEELDTATAPEPDAPDVPVYEGSLMHTEPQVAPDGHVNLSKEDIDNRDKGA